MPVDQDRFASHGLAMAQKLLRRLNRDHALCCVLSLRSGSNTFPETKRQMEDEAVFWEVAHKVAEMAKSHEHAQHPLMLILVTRGTLEDCPQVIRKFVLQEHFVRLAP